MNYGYGWDSVGYSFNRGMSYLFLLTNGKKCNLRLSVDKYIL